MSHLSLRNRVPKKIRFVLVAGGTTLFDLSFCSFLCVFAQKAIAFSISYAVAVCVRFWLDRNFTFVNNSGPAATQFLKYALTCLLSFCLGLLIFSVADRWGFSPFIAKLASIPPVTIFSYLLFERFVFARRTRRVS
jgi:putative flippase GtrA